MPIMDSSPPKRQKFSPKPDSPSQPLPRRSQSPSKLPVRNDSGALYQSPTWASIAKRNPQLTRRSPYAEPVKKRPNTISSSQGEMGARGESDFDGAEAFSARARSEGVSAGIRRTGGSRLSSSPVRIRGSPSNSRAISSVPASEDLSLSPGKIEFVMVEEDEDTKSPLAGVQVGKKSRMQKEATPLISKRKRPETESETQRVEKELAKVMLARVQVLQAEMAELKEGIRIEKARLERENEAARTLDCDTDALVNRLLAANDASLALARPKQKQNEEPVPSARPIEADDPLPELQAFTSITFTAHSTKIILSTPVTHLITASGYTSNRLLYFTISLSVQSAAVQEITYRISPWSTRELTPVLCAAVKEGNISTVFHAISAYTLIAKTRASVFAKLSSTFPHLLPMLAMGKKEKGKVSRRELIPFLGESLLHFHSRAKPGITSSGLLGMEESGVELVLEWRIEFDTTGEPESVVSADTRLPGRLKEVDELNSFSKLGGVFDSLVKEKGVYDATACVVGLLFQ